MGIISGAIYREGIAYSPDGAMYVSVPSGGTLSSPTISNPTVTGTASHTTTPIYNMYNLGAPGDTNTEMGRIDWLSNIWVFRTAVSGSGTNRPIGFVTAGSFRLTIDASGNAVWGNSSTGSAISRTENQKQVTAIANAAATDILTVTIPNGAQSASLKVKVVGSLGAGGAIGANEATATNTYDFTITRTAGVATVVGTSAAYGAAASAVAGAATVTATAAATAMSGAVGATQTFTVQVTISRSGGSSTNHTCLVYWELMNANSSGVTVA